jgi:hypothetical protein
MHFCCNGEARRLDKDSLTKGTSSINGTTNMYVKVMKERLEIQRIAGFHEEDHDDRERGSGAR